MLEAHRIEPSLPEGCFLPSMPYPMKDDEERTQQLRLKTMNLLVLYMYGSILFCASKE